MAKPHPLSVQHPLDGFKNAQRLLLARRPQIRRHKLLKKTDRRLGVFIQRADATRAVINRPPAGTSKGLLCNLANDGTGINDGNEFWRRQGHDGSLLNGMALLLVQLNTRFVKGLFWESGKIVKDLLMKKIAWRFLSPFGNKQPLASKRPIFH